MLCFGKCYSGGAALIQTREVLEGIRKLVSTQSPYPRDARNGGRRGDSSLDLNDIRQSLPLSTTSSDAVNGKVEESNGVVTENGHGVSEDVVHENNSNVVDEPQEKDTPDLNVGTDPQNAQSS